MFLLPENADGVKKFAEQFCVAFRTSGYGPVGAAWRHVTMDSGAFPLKSEYPVAIVGAGPVGLTTALALSYYEIPFVVFEANAGLSTETKAGTTLSARPTASATPSSCISCAMRRGFPSSSTCRSPTWSQRCATP